MRLISKRSTVTPDFFTSLTKVDFNLSAYQLSVKKKNNNINNCTREHSKIEVNSMNSMKMDLRLNNSTKISP